MADKTVMICLHGFPENSWSWYECILTSAGGFQVIAPDLPGYNDSPDFEQTTDYKLPNLISTLAEFVTVASKGKPEVLVAYDWRSAIA